MSTHYCAGCEPTCPGHPSYSSAPGDPGVPRYTWGGWESEPDMTGDGSGDPDKHYATIYDSGEEMAVIVHRTCKGLFPLAGRLACEKLSDAQRIAEALNAAQA